MGEASITAHIFSRFMCFVNIHLDSYSDKCFHTLRHWASRNLMLW